MADIYCPVCAEPFDLDEFHDIAADTGKTFSECVADFKRHGCAAMDSHCNAPASPTARAVIAAAYELGGDDIDGVCSDLDDAAYLGYFE